jgi:hypothetical protein
MSSEQPLKLRALFGDISDDDDPTYCVENDPEYDSEDSVPLEDLLSTKQYEKVRVIDTEHVEKLDNKKEESSLIVQGILNDIFNRAWKMANPLKRWRKANPETWAYNIAKKRRADGLTYKIKSKDRPAKIPKYIDCSNCKYKCTEVFSITERNEICRFFLKFGL